MPRVALKTLFNPEQVDGPLNRSFTNVAMRGRKAGGDSLYLVREWAAVPIALHNGCLLFAGLGPRPAALAVMQGVTWIQLSDLDQTIFQIGEHFRSLTSAKRIVITGSSGKTNTKDMIAHLLRERYPGTAKTPGNMNGFRSIPLLMARFPTEAPYWVIEIGLDYNRKNSIQPRAAAVKPQVAVVTTVSFSHVAYLGSMDAVASEKSQVVRELEPGGLAVLNGDNQYCREMAKLTTGPVVFFGLGPQNEVRATGVRQTSHGIRFVLHVGQQSAKGYLHMIGLYHVYNALAATAVARWAGLSIQEIAHRLRLYRPHTQHGKVYRTRHGWLIDDGYNSNPTAVQGVLDTLNAIRTHRQKILVIGDMQELGPYTEQYYSLLAKRLQMTNVAGVIFYGKHVRRTYEDLPRRAKYHWAKDERDAARTILESCLSRNCLIWLKSNDYIEYGQLRRRLLSDLGWLRTRSPLRRR